MTTRKGIKISDLLKERSDICKSCENYDLSGKGCSEDGTQPCCDIRMGGCGCPINDLINTLSASCPLNKWQEINNN